MTALRAGLRLGELLGLGVGRRRRAWSLPDVRRNRSGGKVTTPKSGKSRRVDMSDQLAETLQRLHVERKAETLRNGWGQVPETVFVTEGGRPYDAANLRQRAFYKTLSKAGLRRVRLHDLRHTYASLLHPATRESRIRAGSDGPLVHQGDGGYLWPPCARGQPASRQPARRLQPPRPGNQPAGPSTGWMSLLRGSKSAPLLHPSPTSRRAGKVG